MQNQAGTKIVGCKRTANMNLSLKFNKTTIHMASPNFNAKTPTAPADGRGDKTVNQSFTDFCTFKDNRNKKFSQPIETTKAKKNDKPAIVKSPIVSYWSYKPSDNDDLNLDHNSFKSMNTNDSYHTIEENDNVKKVDDELMSQASSSTRSYSFSEDSQEKNSAKKPDEMSQAFSSSEDDKNKAEDSQENILAKKLDEMSQASSSTRSSSFSEDTNNIKENIGAKKLGEMSPVSSSSDDDNNKTQDSTQNISPNQNIMSTPLDGQHNLAAFIPHVPSNFSMSELVGKKDQTIIQSPPIKDVLAASFTKDKSILKEPNSLKGLDSPNMSLNTSGRQKNLFERYHFLHPKVQLKCRSLLKQFSDDQIELTINSQDQFVGDVKVDEKKITKRIFLKRGLNFNMLKHFGWTSLVSIFQVPPDHYYHEVKSINCVDFTGSIFHTTIMSLILTAIMESIETSTIIAFKEHKPQLEGVKEELERSYKNFYIDIDYTTMYYIDQETLDAATKQFYKMLNIQKLSLLDHRQGFLVKFLKFEEYKLLHQEVNAKRFFISGEIENINSFLKYMESLEGEYYEITKDLAKYFDKCLLATFLNNNGIYFKIIYDGKYKIFFCAENGKFAEIGLKKKFDEFYGRYQNGIRLTKTDCEYIGIFYQDPEVFDEFVELCKKTPICRYHAISTIPTSVHEERGIIFKNYGNDRSPEHADLAKFVNEYLRGENLKIEKYGFNWEIPSLVRDILLNGEKYRNEFADSYLMREFNLNLFDYIIKHYESKDSNEITEHAGLMPMALNKVTFNENISKATLLYFLREEKKQSLEKSNSYLNKIEYEIILNDSNKELFENVEKIFKDFESDNFQILITQWDSTSRKITLKASRGHVIFAMCCYKFYVDNYKQKNF